MAGGLARLVLGDDFNQGQQRVGVRTVARREVELHHERCPERTELGDRALRPGLLLGHREPGLVVQPVAPLGLHVLGDRVLQGDLEVAPPAHPTTLLVVDDDEAVALRFVAEYDVVLVAREQAEVEVSSIDPFEERSHLSPHKWFALLAK